MKNLRSKNHKRACELMVLTTSTPTCEDDGLDEDE